MKKIFGFVILLSILGAGLVFGEQTAVVRSFSGKVEYRAADGTTWSPVSEGMKMPVGSTISTGFDSKAVLVIGGATLNVAPLTRMRIDDLAEKEGVVSTGLYLQVGKVNSDVKSVGGLQNDFVIKSPVTTASVRGTVFEFDGSNLYTEEGVVIMTDEFMQAIAVWAHENGYSSGDGNVLGGDELRELLMLASMDTSDISGPQDSAGLAGILNAGSNGTEFGMIKVNWTYLP
jgi:hypothetical protein